MYENINFFNPCYHQQPGMTYPHDQDLCDHVPEIEGTAYGREYSYAPDYVTNNAQNYNNYYEKSDYECNGQTFNQSYQTNYEIPQAMLPISTNCNTNHEKFVISEEDRDPVKRIFDEISAECEHLLLKKNCEECRMKPNENFQNDGSLQDNSPNINHSPGLNITTINSEIFVVEEETTQLALSMKRKREQNKMAAARYREKRKTLSKTTKAEIGLLEERNLELKKTVKDYQNEINVLRKKLNLPLQ
uniref:BZIP domain-containing protein n=1 Tax=Panagrolaimus sp. PS1159 TaxID=55785 RepID=A0AC35F164_9BILA